MRKRLIFLLVCLFVVAVVLVLNGTMFVVREIVVEEYYGKEVDVDDIVSTSGIKVGKNIFTLSEELISTNIEKNNPCYRVIDIQRRFPDTVALILLQRTSLYAVEYDDKYAILDKDMTVMAVTTDLSSYNVVKVEGIEAISAETAGTIKFDNQINVSRLKQIATTFEQLQYAGENFPNVVDKLVVDKNNVAIHMATDGARLGTVLKFNASTDVALKVQALVSFYNSYPVYRYEKVAKAEQKTSMGTYEVVLSD